LTANFQTLKHLSVEFAHISQTQYSKTIFNQLESIISRLVSVGGLISFEFCCFKNRLLALSLSHSRLVPTFVCILKWFILPPLLSPDDHEGDDDTDVDVEPQEAVAGSFLYLSLKNGNCMMGYCAPGTDVLRICGTVGTCYRCIPKPHKHRLATSTALGATGWYEALAATRKDSSVLDGLASSHRSDEDHQSDLQRRTDDNHPDGMRRPVL
jgi:hypothetical protein